MQGDGTIKNALVFICVVFLWVGCSVNVTITPDLQNPIAITLEGVVEVLAPDSEMTVTARTDPPDTENEYVYQWYLNGVSLDGENGPSITLKGSDLPPGSYRLDIGITSGDILSSEWCFFRVEYPQWMAGSGGFIRFSLCSVPVDPQVFVRSFFHSVLRCRALRLLFSGWRVCHVPFHPAVPHRD